MKRRLSVMIVVVLITLMSVVPAFANHSTAALVVIYVRSQGLYYDDYVTNEILLMSGQFQKLENYVTDYGPGDPGYLGGLWWVNTNGNNIMDAGDQFFRCPLLGPGRATP